MDKYKRMEKPRREIQAMPVDPNEIRITQQGKVRSYISYANGLFAEKNERRVVLKAMGNAISKAVTVAEILKHRVAHLHQITRISSVETIDVYEPLEEGLDRIETTRHIPGIAIELSLDELERHDPGYQSPNARDHVTAGSSPYHGGRANRKSRGPNRRRSGRTGRESAAQVEKRQEGSETEGDPPTPNEEEGPLPSGSSTRGKRGKGRRNGSNGARGTNSVKRVVGEDEGTRTADARSKSVAHPVESEGPTAEQHVECEGPTVEQHVERDGPTVEQHVEREGPPHTATHRKVGARGRKGKRTEKNGHGEKRAESSQGATEDQVQGSKGRRSNRERGRRGRDRGGRDGSNGRDDTVVALPSTGTVKEEVIQT